MAVLDDLRLGKQRVETLQILRALVFPSYRGWKNHPATKMWRGFSAALVAYGLAACEEWQWRGRADAVASTLLEFSGGVVPDVRSLERDGRLPPWLGQGTLHESHRSALVRKLPEHYRGYFPAVPDDLPYVWPPSAFPLWPIRRTRELSLDKALAVCGWTQARPGQRETVHRLLAGDDVTLHWPSGAGATSTALLAALCVPGPTTWITAHSGGTDLAAPSLRSLRRDPTPVRASRTSPSIARPPTSADRRAVRDEWQRAGEIRFYNPATLRRHRAHVLSLPTGLVVAEGIERPPRLPGVPMLRVVVGQR